MARDNWEDIDMSAIPLEDLRDVVEALIKVHGQKVQKLQGYCEREYRVVREDCPSPDKPDWEKAKLWEERDDQ